MYLNLIGHALIPLRDMRGNVRAYALVDACDVTTRHIAGASTRTATLLACCQGTSVVRGERLRNCTARSLGSRLAMDLRRTTSTATDWIAGVLTCES